MADGGLFYFAGPTPHGPRLLFGVSCGMSRNVFCLHGRVALAAGAATLLLLTGCVGDMPHSGGWRAASHNKEVQYAYGIMEVPYSVPVPAAIVRVLPATPSKPMALHTTGRIQPKRRP